MFGLFTVLGYRFSPRLADLPDPADMDHQPDRQLRANGPARSAANSATTAGFEACCYVGASVMGGLAGAARVSLRPVAELYVS